jgi:hypothetical protein
MTMAMIWSKPKPDPTSSGWSSIWLIGEFGVTGARHRREYLDAGHAGRRVEVPDRHRVGVRRQGAHQHGRQQ